MMPAVSDSMIDGKTPEKLPNGPLLIFTPGACDLWQMGDAIADPLVSRVEESAARPTAMACGSSMPFCPNRGNCN